MPKNRAERPDTTPEHDGPSAQPRNEAESSLLIHLQTMAEGMDRIIKGHLQAVQIRYFLEHGRFFNPSSRPKGFRRRAAKACFKNSQTLAMDHPELTYAEGFARSAAVGFPVEHAWCVGAEGRVIDMTWKEVGMVYFGITLESKQFIKVIADEGEFRMIHDFGYFSPDAERLPGGVIGKKKSGL